jgi:uncharacterized protein (DUF1697 family)
MNRYVAFLRGINLGNRRIKMDELRTRFEEMKFAEVATFIASGNVIFSSKAVDPAKLVAQIEKHLHASLGYPVDTFVRTQAEVAAVAAYRPFPKADLEHPANTVHVGFLAEPLNPAMARGFVGCRTEVDELHLEGREYFWLCRIKSHESKVWTSPPMRALKLPSSSMRNLTTIRKLAEQFPA